VKGEETTEEGRVKETVEECMAEGKMVEEVMALVDLDLVEVEPVVREVEARLALVVDSAEALAVVVEESAVREVEVRWALVVARRVGGGLKVGCRKLLVWHHQSACFGRQRPSSRDHAPDGLP
jgi:hypothetical protein